MLPSTTFHRVVPAVLGVLLLAACDSGGPDGGADASAQGADASVVDTTTLSPEAIGIAAFTYDTVRRELWRATQAVPARMMLDPTRVRALGSITEGRVTQVRVQAGDRVAAGQVLVAIHSHELMDARAALARADAGVIAARNEQQLARAAADRADRLLEARAMSRAEHERMHGASRTADAMLSQAVAEQHRAANMVEHLVGTGPVPAGIDEHEVLIRTPIAGVVTARDVQAGQVVLPGTPLVIVADPSAVLLQMRVSESFAAQLRAGAPVQFTVNGTADRHGAVVSRVAPTVDTLTRTVEVLATPTRTGRLPLAESFAQATIDAAGGALVVSVPREAVQVLEGDTVLIAAEPRGASMLLRAVPVKVGRLDATRAEILAGASPGLRVVVGGAAIARAELLEKRGVGGEE